MSYINEPTTFSGWTFLSNHSHVLICLAQNPMMKMREVAIRVGITERAVQRIIAELESSGVLTRTRQGRQNSYAINTGIPLRHALESHRTIGDLLKTIIDSSDS